MIKKCSIDIKSDAQINKNLKTILNIIEKIVESYNLPNLEGIIKNIKENLNE